jgi:hypothetical protein
MADVLNPINAFPQELQEIINHYAETKGYPIEYFCTALLGAASTALGRSITLNAGSYEGVGIIWAAIVGRPGMTKSEAQTDAFAPITDAQFDIIRRHNNEVAELKAYQEQNPKDKRILPNPQRFLLSDITPESLSMELSNNPKGCGIVYDELAGFIGRFNRYNSGADEQMFLSLFNGDKILRTRVNSDTNAAIKKTFLTIIGTIQPAILKEVFQNRSESGFFDRWLLCFPDNVKKSYPNRERLDNFVKLRYHGIIGRLINLEYQEHQPFEMQYSKDSYDIVYAYQCELIDMENETDKDSQRAVLSKMEVYLHRFALILQSLIYVLPESNWDNHAACYVSKEAAEGAVTLCKYFISQAEKIRILSPVEILKDNWKSIYDNLPGPGNTFDRQKFISICQKFDIKQRRADMFLKEHADRSETKLFFKVSHGLYTKNLF